MNSFHPYNIIKNHLDHFKNKINIFEGGFNTFFTQPLKLDELFRSYRYYGVNTCEATDVNFGQEGYMPVYEGYLSVYEKYVDYYSYKKEKPLSEKEFNNKYILRFKTKIEDYILSSGLNIKYDIGIFNNLFHLLDQNSALEVVRWFKKHSSANAFIIIGVNVSSECDVKTIRVCEEEEINDWIAAFGAKIHVCDYNKFYKQYLIKKSN